VSQEDSTLQEGHLEAIPDSLELSTSSRNCHVTWLHFYCKLQSAKCSFSARK